MIAVNPERPARHKGQSPCIGEIRVREFCITRNIRVQIGLSKGHNIISIAVRIECPQLAGANGANAACDGSRQARAVFEIRQLNLLVWIVNIPQTPTEKSLTPGHAVCDRIREAAASPMRPECLCCGNESYRFPVRFLSVKLAIWVPAGPGVGRESGALALRFIQDGLA